MQLSKMLEMRVGSLCLSKNNYGMRLFSMITVLLCLLVTNISAQEEVIYTNEFDTYGTWGNNPQCKSEIKNGRLYLNSDRKVLSASYSSVQQEVNINTNRNFRIETSIAIEYKGESAYFGLRLFCEPGTSIYGNTFQVYKENKGFLQTTFHGDKRSIYSDFIPLSNSYKKNGELYKFKVEKIGTWYRYYIDDFLILESDKIENGGNFIGFALDGFGQSISVDYLRIKYLSEDYDPDKTIPAENIFRQKLSGLFREGKKEEAIKYASDLLKKAPTNTTLLWYRGVYYGQMNKYYLAIEDFTKGLEQNVDSLKHIFLEERGLSYSKLKQYDLALVDFNESIRLNSKNESAYIERGNMYLSMSKIENAIEDFTTAIQFRPDIYVAGYVARSRAYNAKGDYESSVKDLKKCLAINPKLGFIYIRMIAPLARMQQFEEARKYYQLSMGNDVNTYTKDENWKYYQYYVQAAAENIPNGDYEIALQQVEKGLTEHGTAVTEISKTNYVNMLSLKGFLLEKLNKKEEATQVYNQSLAINSIQPEVSRSLLAMGNGGAKENGKSTVVVPKVVVPTSTDKTAPTIVITSPQVTRGLKVVQKNKSTIITGKATDPSGIYEVLVNGIEAQVDASGNFSATVPLAIGDNALSVSATDTKMNQGVFNFSINRQAGSAAAPLTPVTTDTDIIPINTSIVKPEGKYYALIIGVQDYKDESINDLDRPVADANSLYQTLIANYTFDKQDVNFLKNPTRDQLFEALELLSKKVKSIDNLLIFYAGHGFWDEARNQGYWFPSDARRQNRSTWLTNADLKEYISAIKSKHTLLISDACFSGGIFKSRSVMAGASRAVKELYELPSRKAMTSGTLKEVPDQSVFIQYLVKRLQQNTEKYLSAEQLYSTLRIAVINNSANGQVPQFGEIKESGDEGGDFIFIKK
jgi:tetratricopeptide (TPR) repeat protein